MALYRALRKHYIEEAGGIVEKDQVIEYSGVPGRYLEPQDKEGDKLRKRAEEERQERAEAAARGEPILTPPVNPLNEPDTAPRLIKSHPTVPNTEGSSGELEGVTPFSDAKARGARAKKVARARGRGRGGRKAGRAKPSDASLSKPAPQSYGTVPDEQ